MTPAWANVGVRRSAICTENGKKRRAQKPARNAPTRWERDDEDVRLMLRFQKGEQGAFDELVRRNVQKVHSLVYRFLGDASQVDDITQEVFLRVYRAAANYRPAAKFSTWLYRIVANLSLNAMRSARKGRTGQVRTMAGQDDETFFRQIPDSRYGRPDEALVSAELAGKIAEAVDRLPEKQKIAIILRNYERKSYEDIAALLACSPMVVKSLLSRARRNLRDALAGYLRNE